MQYVLVPAAAKLDFDVDGDLDFAVVEEVGCLPKVLGVVPTDGEFKASVVPALEHADKHATTSATTAKRHDLIRCLPN